MTTFSAIGIWVLNLAVFVTVLLILRKRDFKRGFKAGHDAGRIAADAWWMDTEDGVSGEREKVWREEIG